MTAQAATHAGYPRKPEDKAAKGEGRGKGLWRPKPEVASRHVGHWRYLAKAEGEFRIQLDERGALVLCLADASGVLLPQEKRWLQAELATASGEAAGVARVRFSEKTESMQYALPGAEEPTAAYRVMSAQEANRVCAEEAVALANKASRLLDRGLASASDGAWRLARQDLTCLLQDLEAGKDYWEDGPGQGRGRLVASGRCLVVLRLRGLCADALAGLAECALRGGEPKGQEALAWAEKALRQEPGCLEALLQKGLALLELGRVSEAEGALKEGLLGEGSAVLARSAAESQEVLEQLGAFRQDESLLQQVQRLREAGNEHVRQGRYADAAWCYEDSLQALWGKDLIYPSEVAERAKRKSTGLWRQIREAETAVLTNLSLCCMQGQADWPPSPERALQLCEIALAYNPEHVKAMRRMAHAFCALQRFEEAEATLTSAARLRPKDSALRQDLARVRRQVEGVRRKAKEWEREAYRDMFERLPGFATPEETAKQAEIGWPELHFPTPQTQLGDDEVNDYVAHLAESLEQEGEAAYMMELLYCIRHAVETQFGEGAGKQLARIVPLVQALTRSPGLVKTHEPGKGQRTLASRLSGLEEQPFHDASPDGPFARLVKELPQAPLLQELQGHEGRQEVMWEAPWSGAAEHSWHCFPLVRKGLWTAGPTFRDTRRALSSLPLRPFEAGFARAPAPGLRHEANTNFVLTLHLVLELNGSSYLAEVGERSSTLQTGGVVIFDPTYSHWISSEAEMLIFYCHFYHPEIGEVERYALLLLAQLMERLQGSGVVRGSSLAPAISAE